MPTYEYECDACGHTFDEWQSFTAEVLTKCPACKKKKLRRLFGSGAAILFKGSGFYETDYNRGESYKKSADADKPAETPAAESKPAETTSSTPSAEAPKAKTAAPGKKGGKK